MRTINDLGLALIKSFENCKLEAYQDQVGVWTIGWGHTGNVYAGQEITQDEADALLETDLTKFENGVSNLVKVPITDNQFAALVSFAFNLGLGALGGSTLLKLVNAQDIDGASLEFLKWDHAGGKPSDGLLRRRTAESMLFSEL